MVKGYCEKNNKRRFWTDEEIKYLQDNCGLVSVGKIAKKLNRTPEAIRRKAFLLNLNCSLISRPWTDEEVEYLRKNCEKMPTLDIAEELDRTDIAIRNKANRLGLNYMSAKNMWTNEEVEYLEAKWGATSVLTICRKLGRTELSVRSKAIKLGLGSFTEAREELRLKELLIALGYNGKYGRGLFNRLVKNGFPIVTRKSKRKNFYYVKLNKFWVWAEKNKNFFNFARFKEFSLGEEPDWVKEKRRIDFEKPVKSREKLNWTKNEELLLRSKIYSGRYTLLQLSNDFDRTDRAILAKARELGLDTSFIVQKKRTKWTEKEEEYLISSLKEKVDIVIIAKNLNRCTSNIHSKIYRLREKGVAI
ncbi:gcrA cell cycle regulator family protein (plasmid) [Clostridium baratii str. Sullivan]|uniref:GcrA cell cycle regulator family protein n=1 Tax=Clostridium baratii str. Sullivan TaxID=1415775 RepID=A0A0A7G0E2_9CLOT|nr:hypothetical protein [Clostridium baratii]AIY85303.1 gcrA cell cycle regulator family protein [Clostridium baratii str. Sullivan]